MTAAALMSGFKGCSIKQFLSSKNTLLKPGQNWSKLNSVPVKSAKLIHTTVPTQDLMEFFEDKKNWGETHVKVGRWWRKEDLRIKSNSDLHKLWYVLLKERNMLMTMEHECMEAYEIFPNPERLDKVKESMHNLEEVVIERNRAYHELETGESGLQPSKQTVNQIGLPYFRRMKEHLMPKSMNERWTDFFDRYNESKTFHALLGEKVQGRNRRRIKMLEKHVLGLMRRFPDMDLDAVKEKFPDVNVDKLKVKDAAIGTHRLL